MSKNKKLLSYTSFPRIDIIKGTGIRDKTYVTKTKIYEKLLFWKKTTQTLDKKPKKQDEIITTSWPGTEKSLKKSLKKKSEIKSEKKSEKSR